MPGRSRPPRARPNARPWKFASAISKPPANAIASGPTNSDSSSSDSNANSPWRGLRRPPRRWFLPKKLDWPRGGHYSVGVIHLAEMLVRRAGLSFRGTAVALAVVASLRDNALSPEPMPCATTVWSWVLRLGYAQLTRPLPHRQRWAWLIDHTIQIGSQKLLVIVSVLLDEVPFGIRPLQRSDLHLVAMVPMQTSNQQLIDAELEKAVARTGVPRQIVSDKASDL